MQNLNFNSLLKKANYHRPLIFNSLLWSLALIILLFIFSKGKMPITVDYIYTVAFLITLIIPVSLNFYILIPKFLTLERYVAYSALFITNLVLFSILNILFFQSLLDIVFPNLFFVSYLSNTDTYTIFSIFLITATLLKLAEDWFYFNTNENKTLRLKNQHIETQLSALRAQINPHFLFNSLNVVYALALEKREGVTTAIIQLSDILRYVIYDSDTELVSLKDEIKLLQNYIAFQNHRVEIPNATNLTINITDEQFKIYPMLLLPLLENSYKHGIIAGETKAPINIKLYQKNNHFQFTITNAILNTNNKLEDKHSGVGLVNLKNNLNLVYPKHHQFKIKDNKDRFEVMLNITNEI